MRKKRPPIDRRAFLKSVGAGAATLAGSSKRRGQASAAPVAASASGASLAARKDRVVYRGDSLRAVAMPLGGIGTGTIALAGDGGLRQWQVLHNVNHLAHVPHTFFAFWGKPEGQPAVARVLQSAANYNSANFSPPATTNDHVVPDESRKLLEQAPGVATLEFTGEYPIAKIRYLDPALQAQVSLEAYSPFIPLDSKDSGLPCIVFEFRVRNPGTTPLRVSLAATLQNFIGWDGHSLIAGVEHPAYGGNRNKTLRSGGLTAIELANPRLPGEFAFQGSLALAALASDTSSLAQWDNLDLFWKDFAEDGAFTDREAGVPSAEGRTWNGALAVPATLPPGEETTIVFLIAWSFPNRYVNWSQPALTIDDKKSKFWVGTMYANWFSSAMDAVTYVRDHYTRLSGATRLFRQTFYDSTLPSTLLDCVSSQASIVRTPTCIWVQDGRFHGFEGCCGASTSHCKDSGCCPLDCTHVWNYEQSLSRLFPDLERTMRLTDLEIQQAPEGYIPHRTILPFYLPRPWGKKIGGPENPALDGMLGTVLKTYREYRQGAGREWLARLWPRVKKLLDYVIEQLDPHAEGVIRGEQPNTYDISIYGPNSFIGGLYLAALRAAEEMARSLGEDVLGRRYRAIFEKGLANLPGETWSGEYYVQKVDLEKYPRHQYGAGCHSDQLLGQWWAHQLGLGYILPGEQVRSSLGAILRYNWRESFAGFEQRPRQFASERDRGLLVCTWPKGGRPQTPTLYSDEVWTGIEYEVAGLLLYEGLCEEALKILNSTRARYDGRERSPWNDIECGDHYARAMSSWTLLEAACGENYNAAESYLRFAPKIAPENFRCFFITAGGWGSFEQKISASSQINTLSAAYGKISLHTLELAFQGKGPPRSVQAKLNGRVLAADTKLSVNSVRLEWAKELELNPGDSMKIEIA